MTKFTPEDIYLLAARSYVEACEAHPDPYTGYNRGNVNFLASDSRFRAAVDTVLELAREERTGV